MIYTIDNQIKFDSVLNKLFSCVDQNRSVILTTPAGKCLVLLLESAPDIVGQKKLIESVWGGDGMMIATNTLYQNISMIRKGFRTVSGNDYIYIKTVSRLGFQFSNKVNIVRSEDLISDTSIPVYPKENRMRQYIKYIKIESGAYIFCLFLIFCGVYLGRSEYANGLYRNNYFFSSYQVLTKVEGCTFLNEDNNIGRSKVALRFVKDILAIGVDCKKYPWIYISAYDESPVFTALLCKKRLNDDGKAECDSLYFRETK